MSTRWRHIYKYLFIISEARENNDLSRFFVYLDYLM